MNGCGPFNLFSNVLCIWEIKNNESAMDGCYLTKLWDVSIIVAMLFGMFNMHTWLKGHIWRIMIFLVNQQKNYSIKAMHMTN